MKFRLTSYDGHLAAHTQAEERGELLLGSADRPWDVQLRFEGSPEIFSGNGLRFPLVATATGANSCSITMTDQDDPSVGCSFELPRTHVSDFNSYYADWKRDVEAQKGGVSRRTQSMLIVTTNEISGYRITKVHGDVFGLTVRARNYFSNLGAQLQTVVGGEVSGYTRLLTDSRNEARERMWTEARARGANAVIAMRFDCNEIGGIMSEIAAYGTAVTVEPVAAVVTEILPESQQA